MKENLKIKRFVQACDCFPPKLHGILIHLSESEQEQCEEIRLRAGKPIAICLQGREQILLQTYCEQMQLQEVVSRAARYSVHSYGEALAQGFLPLKGGHRLGICGTAIIKEGKIHGFRMISSLNLRIAQQYLGAADELISAMRDDTGQVQNTLILSPPGYGKTTILRDCIRQLSSPWCRIGVADERGEIAAMQDGLPQFDLGSQTDILDGAPKAQAVILLLKTMSPQIIAMDEITSAADLEALQFAGHCGVKILATAHATNLADLSHRPLYQTMLSLGIFNLVITLDKVQNTRKFYVERLSGGNLCCKS